MKRVGAYFAELATATWEGWDRFWFTPTDPATLGLIRILAGSIILYTHAAWSVDLLGFFGPEGRLPVDYVREAQGTSLAWSHLFWLTSPTALWVAHGLALVVLVLFTVGLWTRVTAVLTALITISYAHRAEGALFGLDQLNGFLALYLAIGPSGAAYSLDRWWKRRAGHELTAASPTITANLAIRLIQVHMCVVYLFAGLGKLRGDTWWEGTALWGAFANYEYQTLDMTWLAGYPLFVNFVTQLILVWEISYCVLVWPRLIRPIVLFLAIPLHLGIGLSMGMMTFGLIMLVGNLAFVPPTLVRSLLDRPAVATSQEGRGEFA